jgi:hypothetical protein
MLATVAGTLFLFLLKSITDTSFYVRHQCTHCPSSLEISTARAILCFQQTFFRNVGGDFGIGITNSPPGALRSLVYIF